jgi:hypothetical protein
MSRKLILTLAAAATISVATFASSSSHARGFGGGGHVGSSRVAGNGGRTLTPILNPGRPGRPGRPNHPGFPGRPGQWAFHHHGHWIFRGGRWLVIDQVADETPDVVPAPAPCTCLTKNYTPDGLVVFADICTKEAASARIDGSAANATQVPAEGKSGDATQAPTSPNYAGLTYQDYLAANPQAAAQKN